MRKLNRPPADSLDLLLDTLCNVFGGIILVACLLALLTRERSGTPHPILTSSEELLLQQRLQAARNEVAGLTKMLATLADEDNGPKRALVSERDQLQETLSSLRTAKEETEKLMGEVDKSDPGAVLIQLRRQVKEARQQLAEASSRAEADEDKERDLLSRLEALKSQTQDLKDRQVQTLRFPKEKEQSKVAFYIILKMGQAFPLRQGDGSIFSGLTEERVEDDGFRVTPERGRGLDPVSDSAGLRTVLNRCRAEGAYVSLLVFPDSFEAFRVVKDAVMSSDLEYGLRVFPEGTPLSFGSNGSSPPPL